MKKISTILIIILSIALVLVILFKPKPQIIFEDNSDKFKKQIDEYKKHQLEFDSTIVILNDSIESLSYIVSEYQSEIKKLKQKRNEKTSVVNKFTNDELYQFLSKRYPKDSIR